MAVKNVCRENIRDSGLRNLASSTNMHYNVLNCARVDAFFHFQKTPVVSYDLQQKRNTHKTSNFDFIQQLLSKVAKLQCINELTYLW
jgi:hypothetical protein